MALVVVKTAQINISVLSKEFEQVDFNHYFARKQIEWIFYSNKRKGFVLNFDSGRKHYKKVPK